MPPPPLVVRCPVRALLHCGDDHIDESSSSSDKGEEEIDRAKAPSNDTGKAGGAVYCPDCEMWLSGPTQWEDHKIGKKHRKNTQKKAGTGVVSTQKGDLKTGSPGKQRRRAGDGKLADSGADAIVSEALADSAKQRSPKLLAGGEGPGVGSFEEQASEADLEEATPEQPKQVVDDWGGEPGQRSGGAGSQQPQAWAAFLYLPQGYASGPDWDLRAAAWYCGDGQWSQGPQHHHNYWDAYPGYSGEGQRSQWPQQYQ